MHEEHREIVGVFDIDGTLMTSDMSPSAIAAAQKVRGFFDDCGTFMVATAQTVEMTWSERYFKASRDRGSFTRPAPRIGWNKEYKRHAHVDPGGIPERTAFTDADVVMGLGTGIYTRKQGWYEPDRAYAKLLKPHWRMDALHMIDVLSEESMMDFDLRNYLAPIELARNYDTRVTNVFPLDHRIQFDFADPVLSPQQNAARKNEAKERILLFYRELVRLSRLESKHLKVLGSEAIIEFQDILGNLVIVDESRPERNWFSFYLAAKYCSKERMIEHATKRHAARCPIDELVIAGDQVPDLRAGCYAGKAKRATFLLVGGSPIETHLRPGQRTREKTVDESVYTLSRYLSATERPGYFAFRAPFRPQRTVVIGSLAYPGTKGPETVHAFIEDRFAVTLH